MSLANLPADRPCLGRHDLFDSTALVDHIEARKLCGGCSFVEGCRERAAEVRALPGGHDAVEGTWGGQLWRSGRISTELDRKQVRAQQDAMFTDEEARRCSYVYSLGQRSEHINLGRRVYDRRRYDRYKSIGEEAS